jgi:hypothetical protein
MKAAKAGFTEIINVLIASGGLVRDVGADVGETAMMKATQRGAIETFKLHIAAGWVITPESETELIGGFQKELEEGIVAGHLKTTNTSQISPDAGRPTDR